MALDPANYAKAGTEHAHQVALFMWASLPEQQQRFPELKHMFAIPNGGERNKIVATRLKAEGVKSGVPDVFLPVPRKGVAGLFIELKRPKSDGKAKGRASGKQGDWSMALQSQNFGVFLAEGWEAARDVIILYLSP
jgi:hypothetical protein